jgi:hypothetical protein
MLLVGMAFTFTEETLRKLQDPEATTDPEVLHRLSP